MKIRYLGHSSFLLTDGLGTRIVTDPYEGVGFSMPRGVQAEGVSVSHAHFDHCNAAAISGNPVIFDKAGNFALNAVQISAVNSFHDEVGGKKRGPNLIFRFQMDGMTVCHFGDLGEPCSPARIESVGPVDILLIPVGGNYTIDAVQAKEYVDKLRPAVIIPMHYKTPKLKIDLCPLAPFIDAAKDCRIHNLNDCEASVSRMSLGEDRVIVLRPYDAERDEA